MVTASNKIGKASVSCTVSVKGRLLHDTSESEFICSDTESIVPKFQLSLQDHKIQEGKSVRLDCVIVGQPEPEVILSIPKISIFMTSFSINFVTFR